MSSNSSLPEERETPVEQGETNSGTVSGARAALGLLFPGLTGPDGAGSSRAIHWLVPAGLLMGLAYAALYRGCWRVFGEVAGVRLLPAVVVWLLDAALLGLPMFVGAARVGDCWGRPHLLDDAADGRQLGVAGVFILVVLLVLKLALWTALPEGILGWPTDWRRHFNFLYPRPVFRPLILAPLWGRWALMLAGSIGRTAPMQDRPILGRAGGASPVRLLGWFLFNLVMTAVYCGRHGRWMIGCIIGLVVLGVTFLFSVVVARRFRGQTRSTVYAAAGLGEIVFLVAYLAFSQRIYRY
ncbi:MAG TPA: hypothetical protein VM243_15195 [Phycisphaerae bacterium]|nr:hypothetical protein [Phycisphaerae bacterium]